MSSEPVPAEMAVQENMLLAKVRLVLMRKYGIGVDEEPLSALLPNMKYTDAVRVLWFSSQYHGYRIYRELLTFSIETEIVKTVQGQLKGRKCVSALGKTYFRFQGVPYAKPPIGNLRFKDPQPPEPWEGVRDALKEGSICAHFDIITGTVRGSEDCLFLNVFTPQLPSEEAATPKAVLVWIHGGGFQLGSGNADVYSSDFFLEEDVILVTLNYRLGALGFLSLGTEECPGNAGLKDMVMALKWIKENIASFGGDPEKVCIFGESAGGAAINYLLLSPLAKGLFSSAISQSGSSLAPWAFSRDATETAFTLGHKFGSETKDPKALIEYLRKIPARTLARKQNAALSEANKREVIPFAFLPCVEPEGPNAFISKDPLTLLKNGDFNHVPYITGVNEMEGMIFLKQIMDKKPPASELEKDFERLVPRSLNLKPGCDKSMEVAKRLRQFYFQNQPFDKKTYKDYIDLTTDINFLDPMYRTTNLIAMQNKAPVYNYEFVYDGNFALFKKLLNIKIKGPAHADEIGYMFYIPIIGPKLDPNSTEMKITKRFVKLWANFAKHGNPTPDPSDPLLPFKWEASSVDSKPYLEIDEEFTIKSDMFKERIDFWKEQHTYSESS